MVKVGHCLPKIFVGDDCADMAKLVHACARLIDGEVGLNNRGLRLGIVQLDEQIAAFHALAFPDHHSDNAPGDLGRNLHTRGYPNAAARHKVLFDGIPNRDDCPDSRPARPYHVKRNTSENGSRRDP
jgi:hypothetical protein